VKDGQLERKIKKGRERPRRATGKASTELGRQKGEGERYNGGAERGRRQN